MPLLHLQSSKNLLLEMKRPPKRMGNYFSDAYSGPGCKALTVKRWVTGRKLTFSIFQ